MSGGDGHPTDAEIGCNDLRTRGGITLPQRAGCVGIRTVLLLDSCKRFERLMQQPGQVPHKLVWILSSPLPRLFTGNCRLLD
jgi:hypothetical protein